MGDILPFRKRRPLDRRRGGTLCREGFHKWVPWEGKQFDVRQGKLVSVYECVRCGVRRTEIS